MQCVTRFTDMVCYVAGERQTELKTDLVRCATHINHVHDIQEQPERFSTQLYYAQQGHSHYWCVSYANAVQNYWAESIVDVAVDNCQHCAACHLMRQYTAETLMKRLPELLAAHIKERSAQDAYEFTAEYNAQKYREAVDLIDKQKKKHIDTEHSEHIHRQVVQLMYINGLYPYETYEADKLFAEQQ